MGRLGNRLAMKALAALVCLCLAVVGTAEMAQAAPASNRENGLPGVRSFFRKLFRPEPRRAVKPAPSRKRTIRQRAAPRRPSPPHATRLTNRWSNVSSGTTGSAAGSTAGGGGACSGGASTGCARLRTIGSKGGRSSLGAGSSRSRRGAMGSGGAGGASSPFFALPPSLGAGPAKGRLGCSPSFPSSSLNCPFCFAFLIGCRCGAEPRGVLEAARDEDDTELDTGPARTEPAMGCALMDRNANFEPWEGAAPPQRPETTWIQHLHQNASF